MLIFLFFLSFSAVAHAQSGISGKVTDADNNAVSFASVVLVNKENSTIVAFAISDERGQFSIDCAGGVYILQVRCLGYEFHQHEVTLSDNEQKNIDIVLAESAVALDEIMIQARDPGIRIREDTITYITSAFTDGSERVLGDVLNRLPGIEVDNRGRVTAHGRQVERILLEGQDFFSGNTQLAVNNLPAEIAETIEVLSNYSEFSLLRGFQSHERTVINIGVNNERIGKTSGNVDVGGGYANKTAAKGNILQIKPKFMTSVLGSFNNTGDEVFSIEDYIGLQGGVSEMINDHGGQVNLEPTDEERRLFFPQNNILSRINGLSALNIAYLPNPSTRINSYFLYNGNSEKTEDINRLWYTAPGNSFETFQENAGKINTNFFNGHLKVNHQKSEKVIFAYKGDISNVFVDEKSSLASRLNTQQINSLGSRDAQSLKTQHSIVMMTSLGKHLLTTGLNFSYSSMPSFYDLQTDLILIPVPLVIQDDMYLGRQNVDTRQFKAGANLSFYYRLNPSIHFKTSLNFEGVNQHYNSDIYQRWLDGSYDRLEADDLQNRFSIETQNYNVYAGISKNTGLLRFRLGAFTHLYTHNSKRVTNIDLNNKYNINPVSELSLYFSQRHRLSLSFSKTDVLLPTNAYVSGIVFDSPFSFVRNSQVDALYASQYKASVSYNIIDLFSNTMFFLFSGYQKSTNRNSNNIFKNNMLTEYNPVLSPLWSNFFMRLNLSKGLWKLPWTMKLTGGYTNSSFTNMSANLENRYKVDNLTGALQFSSNYRKTFDFEGQTGVEYISNASDLGANAQLIQKYASKIKMNVKGSFFAETQLELAINEGNDFKRILYYLNASARYRWNNNFETEITGVNMLNLKRQEWISTSYNGVYMIERNYRQIPGNIMVRLRYRF